VRIKPYGFAIELPSDDAIYPSAPEQLFCLSGSTGTSEALVGAQLRITRRKDDKFECDLMENAKEFRSTLSS
jgi:isochorismate synthase EntC